MSIFACPYKEPSQLFPVVINTLETFFMAKPKLMIKRIRVRKEPFAGASTEGMRGWEETSDTQAVSGTRLLPCVVNDTEKASVSVLTIPGMIGTK